VISRALRRLAGLAPIAVAIAPASSSAGRHGVDIGAVPGRRALRGAGAARHRPAAARAGLEQLAQRRPAPAARPAPERRDAPAARQVGWRAMTITTRRRGPAASQQTPQ